MNSRLLPGVVGGNIEKAVKYGARSLSGDRIIIDYVVAEGKIPMRLVFDSTGRFITAFPRLGEEVIL